MNIPLRKCIHLVPKTAECAMIPLSGVFTEASIIVCSANATWSGPAAVRTSPASGGSSFRSDPRHFTSHFSTAAPSVIRFQMNYFVLYFTLVLRSRIQMAALGHTSAPLFRHSPVPRLLPRSSPSVWGLVWWHLPSSSLVVLVFFCNLLVLLARLGISG